MALESIGIQLLFLGVGEFRRNADAVRRDTATLEGSLKDLEKGSLSLGERLQSLGAGMIAAGRSMTLGLTVPIATLAGTLANAGIQFQDAFQGIAKNIDGAAIGFSDIASAAQDKLGITVTTFEEAQAAAEKLGMKWGELTPLGEDLKQQFIDLGREIPISTIELTKLGEQVAMLGVGADDLVEVTKLLAEIGAVTDISAEQAADGLIHIRNVANDAGLSMTEFINRAGSALVALSNDSSATGKQILDLAIRLSAAGDAAKFTGPEIFAWANTLADVGSRAEAGGTAVSRAISNIMLAVETGDESLKTFAAVTGQSVDQFSKAFEEDASNALLNFISHLRDAIAEGKVNKDMLNEMGLGGVRAFDIIGRLGEAEDKFSKNLGVANKGWEEQIAIQDAAAKRFNDIKFSIQLLINRFTELGNVLIDRFGKHLQTIIELAGQVVDWFSDLDESTQTWIVGIGLAAAAIGPLLLLGGMLVSALSAIVVAFETLAGPIAIVVGALALVVGAIKATGSEAAVLAGIQSAFAQLGDVMKSVFDTLSKLMSGQITLKDLIPPEIITMGQRLADSLSGVVQAITEIGVEIGKLGNLAAIQDAFASFNGNGFGQILSEIAKTASQIQFNDLVAQFQKVSDFAKSFADAFKPFLEAAGPKLTSILNSVRDALKQVSPLLEAFSRLGHALGVEVDWTSIGTALGQVAGVVFTGLIDAVDFLAKGLPAAIDQITQFVDQITVTANAVKVFVDNAITDFINLPNAIQQFVSDATTALGLFIAGIGDSINQFFVNLLGEERWQKLQEVPGKLEAIFAAIWTKIQSALGSVGDWIQTNVLDPIGGALETAWTSFAESLGNLMEQSGFNQSMAQARDDVTSTWSTISTQVIGFVNDMAQKAGLAFQEFQANIKKIWDQIVLDITNALNGLGLEAQKAIQGMVDQIIKTVDDLYNELVGHSIIPDMVDDILSVFDTLVSDGVGKFTDFVNGVISAAQNLTSTIGGIISGIINPSGGGGGGGGGQTTGQPGQGGAGQGPAQGGAGEGFANIPSQIAQVQAAIAILMEALAGAQQQVMLLGDTFTLFMTNVQTSMLALQPAVLEGFLAMGAAIMNEFIIPAEAGVTAFVALAVAQFLYLDDYWFETIRHMVGHWLDFVAAAEALTSEFVTTTVHQFDALHEQTVGFIHQTRDDFRNDFNEIQSQLDGPFAKSMGGATGAFDKMKQASANAADAVKKDMDSICQAVKEAMNCITGSPELIIQHPFERLESFLSDTKLPEMISQTVNPVSVADMVRAQNIVPTSAVTNSSIDNSRSIEINANTQSGTDLANTLVRAARVMEAQVRVS